MCKLRSRKDHAKCSMVSPPACGAGWVIGVRQGVLQPPQPLSLSLKHAVLPVAAGRFSLVPKVMTWSKRLGGHHTKKGFWGQNGLTLLSGIALPCCCLLPLLIGSTALLRVWYSKLHPSPKMTFLIPSPKLMFWHLQFWVGTRERISL